MVASGDGMRFLVSVPRASTPDLTARSSGLTTNPSGPFAAALDLPRYGPRGQPGFTVVTFGDKVAIAATQKVAVSGTSSGIADRVYPKCR